MPLRPEIAEALPGLVVAGDLPRPVADVVRALASGSRPELDLDAQRRIFADMVHGFITMGGRLEAANQAVDEIARGLACYDIYAATGGAGI